VPPCKDEALPSPVKKTYSDDVSNNREELMYMMVLITEELGDVRIAGEYVEVSV
jgi:hypothetical protein